MKSIIIIGGDKRQAEMKKILLSYGFRCRHINSGDLSSSSLDIKNNDIIILPVPVSKDKVNIYSSDNRFLLRLNDVLSKLSETNLIYGGGFSDAVKLCLKEKNITYLDYLDCENVALYNSYLTGLGALKLLFENTAENIRNRKVLITGFGKVGKYTAQILKKMECDVYIAARNSVQLAEASCIGYKVLELKNIASYIYIFDYIFNTVPDNIFSYEDVTHMKGLYFELASTPYGVKKEFFTEKASSYIFGGSLPGKYLCKSAAELLSDITVKHINPRNEGD